MCRCRLEVGVTLASGDKRQNYGRTPVWVWLSVIPLTPSHPDPKLTTLYSSCGEPEPTGLLENHHLMIYVSGYYCFYSSTPYLLTSAVSHYPQEVCPNRKLGLSEQFYFHQLYHFCFFFEAAHSLFYSAKTVCHTDDLWRIKLQIGPRSLISSSVKSFKLVDSL